MQPKPAYGGRPVPTGSPARFLFRECEATGCRLRYPAAAEDPAGGRCPRCGAAAPVVEQAQPGRGDSDAAPPTRPVSALLDNIRSVHNVGSMFRTADGAGLRQLYLCGITATPENPQLAKAALGAQHTVAWTYDRNGVETAARLKSQGYCIWALERLPHAAGQTDLLGVAPPPGELVIVVGNERAGVDPGILTLCDRVLGLPMHGRKGSLNAAVAFGIAVYHLCYAVPAALAGS